MNRLNQAFILTAILVAGVLANANGVEAKTGYGVKNSAGYGSAMPAIQNLTSQGYTCTEQSSCISANGICTQGMGTKAVTWTCAK